MALIHFKKLARRALMLLVAGTAWLPSVSTADSAYPNRLIRIVVPYSTGGSADQTARLLAEPLAQRLGQPVLVDNRPGAAGNIGTQEVANAKPDGYTLLLGFDGTLVVAPNVTSSMPFDTLKSFQPVTKLVNTTLILAANPAVPANNFAELLEYSKKNPKALAYGTTGVGSTLHLGGELLKTQTGISWEHIPYKGGGQALNDTVGGATPLVYTAVATVAQYLKSGRLKAIGVSSLNRSPALPDVPTIAESGVPGFDVSSWFGLLAPTDTPREIVDKLSRAVSTVMSDPALRERYLALGLEPVPGTPEQFTETMKSDLARWKKVATQGNIKLD